MQGESRKQTQRTWMKNTGNLSKYFTHEFTCNTEHFYRPQRSCEGYVFTGVCLSTRGGGVSASVHAGMPPPEQSPPGSRHTPGSRHPRSRHPQEQTHRVDTPQEQTHPLPERRPLLRTVRILLECIFVKF